MANTTIHYTPAQAVTCKPQEDIKAGTFVQIAANVDGRNPVIKTAAANARAFGVPSRDANKGVHVTVYRSGYVLDVQANGEIKAGDPIAVAASGKATKATDPATSPIVGTAVSDSANGTVQVALN